MSHRKRQGPSQARRESRLDLVKPAALDLGEFEVEQARLHGIDRQHPPHDGTRLHHDPGVQGGRARVAASAVPAAGIHSDGAT